jgi:hypothetical protein
MIARNGKKMKQFDLMGSLWRKPEVTQSFGGGLRQETANSIILIEINMSRFRLDPTGAEKAENPVKPVKTGRRVKPVGKTKAWKASMSLKINEIGCRKEGESNHDQSSSVKVSQSALAQPNDEKLVTAESKKSHGIGSDHTSHKSHGSHNLYFANRDSKAWKIQRLAVLSEQADAAEPVRKFHCLLARPF